MDYKLMAVDIDGTLLNDEGKLSENTIKAIRMGVEKGLIFTIATGRPIQGVENINAVINLDLPFITYNGAMVVMGKSRKILYEKSMSSIDAKNIISLGKKYGVNIMVWKNNSLFVEKINQWVERYKKISTVEPVEVENLIDVAEGGVTKILWYDYTEKISEYYKTVGSFLSGNVNYYTSQPFFLEFTDKQASKAIAMEKLGEYFGIDRKEMIAVGDGFNDLPMIEYAGLGVAMGNAPDEVKNKADFITLSNNHDGVAHVIHKFVLSAP